MHNIHTRIATLHGTSMRMYTHIVAYNIHNASNIRVEYFCSFIDVGIFQKIYQDNNQCATKPTKLNTTQKVTLIGYH